MFILRYVILGAAAVGVTLGLFWVMNALITIGLDDDVKKPPPLKNIEIVRLKNEAAAEEEVIELPDKVLPQEAPDAPDLDMPQSDLNNAAGMQINIETPQVSEKVDISLGEGPKLNAAVSDTDAVPMVRVQPMYPPGAAQQRLEGYVRMEFTIGKTGSVKDVKVIEGKPPGVFDDAAVKAIKKWKYKAKVVDGKRVERHGIRVKLKFELDNM